MTAAGASTLSIGRVPCLYLDANVLLPEYLRAVFLELADTELASVHWGPEILAEVRRNLVRPRFGHDDASADRLIARMNKAFPQALVQRDEGLEARFFGRTDPKDVHVAAGALKLSLSPPFGRDVCLVTGNLRHLPDSAFAGTRVRSAQPNQVLKALLAGEPRAADALSRMIERFRMPPLTKGDMLIILEKSGCKGFAAALAEAWDLRTES